jgi:hypothetical protein
MDPVLGGLVENIAAGPPWNRAYVALAVWRQQRLSPLVKGTRVQLAFSSAEEGRLDAGAGCNSLSFQVAFDAGQLIAQGPWSTLIACADQLAEQECWLIGLLTGRPTWYYGWPHDQPRLPEPLSVQWQGPQTSQLVIENYHAGETVLFVEDDSRAADSKGVNR